LGERRKTTTQRISRQGLRPNRMHPSFKLVDTSNSPPHTFSCHLNFKIFVVVVQLLVVTGYQKRLYCYLNYSISYLLLFSHQKTWFRPLMSQHPPRGNRRPHFSDIFSLNFVSFE
jgi:hypothetical protein